MFKCSLIHKNVATTLLLKIFFKCNGLKIILSLIVRVLEKKRSNLFTVKSSL